MTESAVATPSDKAKFRADLSAFRRSVLAPDGPTDERIARGGFAAMVEEFDDPLRIGADGRPTSATVRRKRVRMLDSPLERLASRELLCPGDNVRNAALADAARWYRATHRAGGGEPLQAQDPAKPFVSGGTPKGFFRTDWQIDQFAKWVEAREAITSKFQAAVDDLVLYERDLAAIGRRVSGHRNVNGATAVALFCIRSGIEDIAVHRGMFDRKRSARS